GDQLPGQYLDQWKESGGRERCGGDICDVRVQCGEVFYGGEAERTGGRKLCAAEERPGNHLGGLESDACRQGHGYLEGSVSDGDRRCVAAQSICDQQTG